MKRTTETIVTLGRRALDGHEQPFVLSARESASTDRADVWALQDRPALDPRKPRQFQFVGPLTPACKADALYASGVAVHMLHLNAVPYLEC